jgi:hypothetical protein
MHADDVRFVMSFKPDPLGGTEYLDWIAHRFTPEEMEEHRRLHEEVAAIFRNDMEGMEARQAEVARELAEKGYVEMDEVDPAEEEAYDKWASALWESLMDKPILRNQKYADPGGPGGWTVRPHDAQEDEDEYEYEDEYDEEDEYEYDEDEDEDNEVQADEDGDSNGQTHSNLKITTPQSK